MKTVSWIGLGLILAALTLATGCHEKPTDSGDATPHPSITITSPNGGESWVVGQIYSVTWSSSNIVGNLKIEYCGDYPSDSWTTLIDDKANSGSYSWHVTRSRTQTARVRISSLDEPAVCDLSDEDFALTDAWTVMVYADGNNNLDGADNNTSYCIQNIQNMEAVSQTYGINIIAMLSSIRLDSRARYYRVEYHPSEAPDQISSPVLEDRGTEDMSDPATLREFLDYCKANYPALHYVLVIDDHGEGWRGCCLDEVNGGGELLTLPELKSAIIESEFERVDIITYHACQMAAVEVANELRECADFMTAGQFAMPMEAVLGADLWLAWLRSHLDATPSDFCHKIVESVIDAAGAKEKTTHYAQIDLSAATTLSSRIETFGNRLVTETNGYWDEVAHAWTEAHAAMYDYPSIVDLREFAANVLLEPNLSQISSIHDAAENIIDAVGEAIPFSLVFFHPTEYPVSRGGLNIYFPFYITQFDSADYVALEFSQTNWQSFLSNFLTCKAPPTQCCDAVPIAVGMPVIQYRFDDQTTQHWFEITLEEGDYRFLLCDFPAGADYDLYSFLTCDDFPDNPAGCTSDQEGCEDFICSVQHAVNMRILVNAYQGPMGGYRLLIDGAGGSARRGAGIVALEQRKARTAVR